MSFFSNQRIEERKGALEIVSDLKRSMNSVIVIHYSCESFYKKSTLPRITAICVKNKFNGSTSVFSISLQAQMKRMDVSCLTETDFDRLELEMLQDFYNYVGSFKTSKWVHWNMSNVTYGFDAIANRCKILGGTPINIEQQFRYDLNDLMFRLFTDKFEEKELNGRLLNLAVSNGIGIKDALKGADEAIAFEHKKYQKLSMSTVKKVDILNQILEMIVSNNLKVKATKYEVYGLTVLGIMEIVKNNWILSLIYSIIIFICGLLLEDHIKNIFK